MLQYDLCCFVQLIGLDLLCGLFLPKQCAFCIRSIWRNGEILRKTSFSIWISANPWEKCLILERYELAAEFKSSLFRNSVKCWFVKTLRSSESSFAAILLLTKSRFSLICLMVWKRSKTICADGRCSFGQWMKAVPSSTAITSISAFDFCRMILTCLSLICLNLRFR